MSLTMTYFALKIINNMFGREGKKKQLSVIFFLYRDTTKFINSNY